MLLNTEVSQLIIGDLAVIVSVVPEHVSCNIFELVFVLLQKSDQSILDFLFVKLFVLILVVRNQELHDSLSDLSSEGVVGEGELLDDWTWLRRRWRSIVFKAVRFIVIFVIFKDIEFVSIVFQNSQESLDPIKVFFKADPSITILIDFGKDLVKDGLFEF